MTIRFTFFSVILVLFISFSVFAQYPDTIWTRTYGGYHYEQGRCIKETNDNGFIIAGYFSEGGSWEDIYLLKLNSNCDTMWSRVYGDSQHDRIESVVQTEDNGYICAGYRFSSEGYDMRVMRTDSNGDSLWLMSIGVANYWEQAYYIEKIGPDRFVIVGNNETQGNPGFNIYLVCIDLMGNIIWTNSFIAPGYNFGYSVRQCSDGSLIIAGRQGAGTGGFDVYLIKTDQNGDSLWAKTYGGNSSDWGYSAIETSEGGFAIVGWTDSFGAGYRDVYLIKTDVDGDTLWTKTFGGSLDDEGYTILETADGGYLISGLTKSFGNGGEDVFLIRTDQYGNEICTRYYGGTSNERGQSIIPVSDNSYMIAGYTFSFGGGFADVYLMYLEEFETTILQNSEEVISMKHIIATNYPNPFNYSTTIEYDLPKSGQVRVNIYDLLGRCIETLVNEEKQAGQYQIVWDASDYSSGVYFYRIEAGDFTKTRKTILLK
ncbi:MAG: T9SS type A sorting domain-containing protein [Candidatus Zixiibacteriota bacterium]|nr:MAG: T9SS type A sorting domain-containing protein [candidate division Zixibacteria bacterium]